jgi:DNA invertase Pin-like site-specific DNA recombinase
MRRPEVAAGMAAARQKGVRLGRPTAGLPASAQRIDELREQGMSLAAIAMTLGHEKVPTLSGRGSWSKSSVQYVLGRLGRQRTLAPVTRAP